MSVGRALKAALRDLYENSWRLLVVNSAVSAVAIAAAVAASYAQPALLLLVLVGPAVAALMHCAVKLQQTDEVCMRDALDGLRLHWRRGLVLWTLLAATLALAVLAIWFYARRGAATWPLAVAAFYVFALFAVWQLHVWPLAIAERGRSRVTSSARRLAGWRAARSRRSPSRSGCCSSTSSGRRESFPS
jgi:hypothetical protein